MTVPYGYTLPLLVHRAELPQVAVDQQRHGLGEALVLPAMTLDGSSVGHLRPGQGPSMGRTHSYDWGYIYIYKMYI